MLIEFYMNKGKFRARKSAIYEDYIESESNILLNLIRERFSSFRMCSYIPLIFDFTDEADEAAFILWSCDGIEI